MGNGVDVAIFRWIDGWPDALTPFLRFFSVATTLWWVKAFLAALLLGLVLAGGRYRMAAIVAMCAWPIANGLTDLFKNYLPHGRPFQDLDHVALRVGWSDSAGTASAHSANMAAVATVFLAFSRPLGWAWTVVAGLTGLSRVFCGAHYPSQVLLGYTCGILAAWVALRLAEVVVRRFGKTPKVDAVDP